MDDQKPNAFARLSKKEKQQLADNAKRYGQEKVSFQDYLFDPIPVVLFTRPENSGHVVLPKFLAVAAMQDEKGNDVVYGIYDNGHGTANLAWFDVVKMFDQNRGLMKDDRINIDQSLSFYENVARFHHRIIVDLNVLEEEGQPPYAPNQTIGQRSQGHRLCGAS